MNKKERCIAWKHFFTETTDIYQVYKKPGEKLSFFSGRTWAAFIAAGNGDYYRLWRLSNSTAAVAWCYSVGDRDFLHYETSNGKHREIDITEFYEGSDDE